MITRICAAAALVAAAGVGNADVIPGRATLDGILGADQVFEDFESYDVVVGGADNLDIFSLDSNSIANGQGPGLVEPGATYLDPSQIQLQWNGDGYVGLESKTLMANGTLGSFWILYDTPMRAMGLDLRAFAGFGWTGSVDVYGTGDVLLGSIPVSLASGGTENVFAGWEDVGGITRVEISSPDYGWSPIADNHGYGIPAPASLAPLTLAAGLVRRRRA